MSIGIIIEHSVAHVYTQNGLMESFIKCLQIIARPLLVKTKLLTSIWDHVTLHDTSLVCIRLTTYYQYSSLQLVFGHKFNISHLRFFVVLFKSLFHPPQCTKMGRQQRLEIYVGFDSPSIIRYLKP